jgi:hypothetical protein
MPNAGIIQSFIKQSGKKKEEVERLWRDTEKIIKKQYPDKKDDDFYRLVVGVLKKRLGIAEEDAAITTTSMGGAEAQYRTKVLNTVARFGDFNDMDDWGRTTSDVGPKRKKKKRNESVELAIEYINTKLDEDLSPQVKKLSMDLTKAKQDLLKFKAKELRKNAGKYKSGAQKKVDIIKAKLIQQQMKDDNFTKDLTVADVMDKI